MTTDLFGKTLSRLTEMVVVRLSTVAAEVLLLQSIFALYQCEAFLRDSRSLREDSRSVCGRERSVVRPDFAECESKKSFVTVRAAIGTAPESTAANITTRAHIVLIPCS